MGIEKTSYLCWLDLEMTGLDPSRDVILEVAVQLTTMDLQSVSAPRSWVVHHPDLPPMIDWVSQTHTQSGLLADVASSTLSTDQVEHAVLDYINQHTTQTVYVAGNSVYQDRRFLHIYMPRLDARFHYRIVDVSSIKVLVQAWYPQSPHADFAKRKAHRALDDVGESQAELAHYRKYFFTRGS